MRRYSASSAFVAFVLLTTAAAARAQEPASEQRPTGQPNKGHWTFNFDAGLGLFGFANSLYSQGARPDDPGDLSDNWIESFVKPAVSVSFPTGKSELYGKFSVVGERTFAAPPPLVGEEASSFQVEDAHLGWRSGTALGGSENLLELTVGRAQYKIGHGMILWDGGGEGGTRGGFWSNARKAWQFAGVARLAPKNHTFEVFYLDRDEVPESETGTRVFGANYQLALGDATTIGASYLQFQADSLPARDGMDVYNLRAYTAPLRALPGLSFELEFAREENADLVGSTAWNALAAYQLSGMNWQPKISYRYAVFQGDDPGTATSEAFDPLIPGFYDWGTWWQGEIGGEYFLSNSNLQSHQLRVHVTPSEAVSGGVFAYQFRFDQLPGGGVTSKDIAFELDGYVDWKVNANFLLSFIAAFATPQTGAEQATGRTDSFAYGMIYVGYSY
jgi:hypothetical protein